MSDAVNLAAAWARRLARGGAPLALARGGYEFRLALRTIIHSGLAKLHAREVLWSYLENRLSAALIASCAYLMRWFGAACIRFQRIDERTGIHSLQLIAILLSLPCFKISNFLFKCAYALQRRELVRLGRECALLGGEDLSLQFDRLLPNDVGFARRYYQLHDIASRLKRGKRL